MAEEVWFDSKGNPRWEAPALVMGGDGRPVVDPDEPGALDTYLEIECPERDNN